MLDVRLTVTEIAVWLRCPRHRVANWVARGWMSPDGHRTLAPVVDETGVARYPLADALAADRDTRRNTRRSHRRAVPAGG